MQSKEGLDSLVTSSVALEFLCFAIAGLIKFTVICLQVTFNNPIKYGKAKELFIAPEGLYSGQVSSTLYSRA